MYAYLCMNMCSLEVHQRKWSVMLHYFLCPFANLEEKVGFSLSSGAY